MSTPDPTGDSLESILASIRKSLSEQSTDVLDEVSAAPADVQNEAKAGAPRKDGLAQRLAGTEADASQVDEVETARPDQQEVPDPAADPPPPAPPAPASPAASRKDPLWFLSRRGEPAAKENGQGTDTAQSATAVRKAPPAEPKAARAEIVRGPLPPFFGSSAEATKIEVVPVQPIASGVGVMLPPAEPPMVASAPPTGGPSARNGRAGPPFGQSAAEGKSAPEGDNPHVHALESMVSELLRPMLRQWLEENMPRLVSAALKDEAARMSKRDSKKP